MTSLEETGIDGVRSVEREELEDETEDEEVRMNCIGGFRGVEDSDMNTTDHSECGVDEDDDDDDDHTLSDDDEEVCNERDDGVVKFVTDHVPTISEVPQLICPKATKRLSPHEEEENEDASSDSDNVMVKSSLHPSKSSEEEEVVPSDDEDSVADGVETEGKVTLETPAPSFEADDPACDDKPDFELSDIFESLGDALVCKGLDESEASLGKRYIGVMHDRELEHVTIPKHKRVLSYNTLTVLNADAGRGNDHLKRARNGNDTVKDLALLGPTALPSFSLGLPALQGSPRSRSLKTFITESTGPEPTALTPDFSSSDEDEDLDRQLGEELESQMKRGRDEQEEETPVPLLTPPSSPPTIQVDGKVITLCEWPSNLIVDNALQAVNELRPMSPASLENLERDEQDRMAAVIEKANMPPVVSVTTGLTPMLQSISVGINF